MQARLRLRHEVVRRVREHRAVGQRTVLITGAIRPLTRPLEPLFDHIEAADLAVDDKGVCTGHLQAPPLVGESRAAWLRYWAGDRTAFHLGNTPVTASCQFRAHDGQFFSTLMKVVFPLTDQGVEDGCF